MKNWWRSLQVKIIAWSFVPTAIILSAAAWLTFYSYQRVLGDVAIKQDWAIVQTKTQPVFQAVIDIVQPIFMSIYLGIDTDLEAPIAVRAQDILDHAKNLEVFDGGIYFVDQQGKVFKTWPEQPELHGQDWSGTPQFAWMQDHPGKSAFHDLKQIESSGKQILCVSTPMNDPQSKFVGGTYYCFQFYPVTQNAFYRALANLTLGPNMMLLDGNLRVIFSSNASEIGRDLSKEVYLQQLLQGSTMSGRFRNGDEDVLVSYSPISALSTNIVRWDLLKEERWTDVMRPSLPYRQLLSVVLAMGVIVPVVVTAYGVRHITDPIQKLIRATEQVTAGRFGHQIEVTTGDEIETLADQFNLMSAKLDDSYSSLEKKVADRTRALALMNSILSVASRSMDIQEILEETLSITVEQMGFDAGAAFRHEPDPVAIRLAAQRGFEPAMAMELANRYVITALGTAAEPPPTVATYVTDESPAEWGQSRFHLLVSVQLSAKGRRLGLFLLGRCEPGRLSAEELSLLSAIGQQIGVAIETAHLYEQAEETAIATERRRLARELHDAVTQTLFSANLIADVIPRVWKRNPEDGLQNLEELRQLTRGALAEMRTLLLEMRPESLARSDLKSLLTQLADAFVGRVRVPLHLEIHGDGQLPQDVKIVFYRVAQEALNNIAKHSGARQVELHAHSQPGHMHLCIQDDGLGFDAISIPPGHLGMAIMRERAGSIGACLQIASHLGQGTTVELDWRSARKEGPDGHISDNPGDAGG